MTDNTALLPLTIAVESEAHRFAEELAAEQRTPKMGKQVYLNTLAVYTVYSFLEWMDVETDLNTGDSWNPYLCGVFDIADLVIPNLGKIKCRPVLPEDTAISLPPEATEDRIAYVGVRFQEQLDKAELLGFIRAVDVPETSTTIDFDQLEPIENLIDYLFRLESGISLLQEEAEENQKVQQLLETTPISVIVAQLERILRIEPKFKHRKEAEKVMLSVTGTAGGTERGSVDISQNERDVSIAAQKLGKSLLDKLSEMWVEPA